MEKKCSICDKVFLSKTNGKYCSQECKNIASRKNYSKRTLLKDCVYCSNPFEGTKQERLCHQCKGSRKNNYSTKEVSILCRKCKKSIRKEIKLNTNTSHQSIGETCEDCLLESSKARSEQMKKSNPMYNAETRVKVASTLSGIDKDLSDYVVPKCKQEKMSQEEIAEKMRTSNPMHKKEIREKVAQSLKEGYATGRISKVTGSDHWLWKGNRDRAQVIRTRLYPVWIRPILERDNFTCSRCMTKGGRLEVHHIDPTFREIVEEVLNGRLLSKLKYDEFEEVSRLVLEKHANAIGITYCINCHKDVDEQRR